MALSISKAWDETSAILRSDSKLVIAVVAALVMVPAALDTMIAPPTAELSGDAPASGSLVGLIALMIGLVAQIAVTAIGLNRGSTVGEAIRVGTNRFFTVLAAGLLFFVPLTLLLIVLLVGLVGPEELADFPARVAAGQVSGNVILVFFAWLLVLIFFGVRFALSTAVAVAEGSGPAALLKRSWALTRGHFWRILGFIVLLGLGMLVVTSASAALFGFVVSAALGAPEPMSVSALLLGLINGAFQALFIAIYMLMLARIYAQVAAVDPSVPNVERA